MNARFCKRALPERPKVLRFTPRRARSIWSKLNTERVARLIEEGRRRPAGQAAIDWIRGIVAEPELGVVYNGKVVKVVDFGAFVNFLGSRDGLVHISELKNERVGKVADVVKQGDEVDFTGTVTRAANGFAAKAGVSDAEGADQLTEQGHYVLVQACTLVFGLLVVFVYLATDLVYARLDPRARLS